MDHLIERRENILRFYAKYSTFVDKGIQFVLALMTFILISSNIGFVKSASNPVVVLGIAVVCTFFSFTFTVIAAVLFTIMQFYALSLGVAFVATVVFVLMFIFYFRYVSNKAMILLLTPLAFAMKVPMIIPIMCGLIGGPTCAVPIIFGLIACYMITFVKSYEKIIKETATSGIPDQIITFLQQVFNNKDLWVTIIAFVICLLVVYNIRRSSIDNSWKIAIISGALVYALIIVIGKILMNLHPSYVKVIGGTIISVVVAIVLEFFVFSLDYSRTERMQFEDDEYFYYVKAVPKVTVAAPEKTVKRINERQDTATVDEKNQEDALKNEVDEMLLTKVLEEELDLQELLGEEVKH